jgi:nitroreductase
MTYRSPRAGAELLERIAAHRSVRAFLPEEPPQADIERAIRAAQMASTSSHLQAYHLLRVRSAQQRAELVELCGGQPWIAGCGAFFVILADLRRLELAAALHGRRALQNFESFLVAVIDAALFAQNLALSFEAQEYGICFIGGLRNRLPEVDRLLEVPAGLLPLFGCCVGRPAEPGEPRPRLPLAAVFSDGRFSDPDAQRAAIETHDQAMLAWNQAQGRPGRDWSRGVARKVDQTWRVGLADFFRSKGAVLDG